jgi:hypothetical protein
VHTTSVSACAAAVPSTSNSPTARSLPVCMISAP